jgi:hypothetical protein
MGEIKIWKSLSKNVNKLWQIDSSFNTLDKIMIDAEELVPSNASYQEVLTARSRKLFQMSLDPTDVLMIEMCKPSDKEGDPVKWTFEKQTELDELMNSDAESEKEELKMQSEVNEPGVQNVSELESILPRGVLRGRMGVQNMGHSCCLGAAIQCLSHTMDLTKYFLFEHYKKDLNLINPAG